MFELLMAAIRSRDEETVIRLLPLVPASMLSSLDFTNSNVLHYLARFNLSRGMEVAKKLFAIEKFTEKNDEDFTPFITAVYFNSRDVVAYLEKNNIDKFVSKIHRDSFFNTMQLSIDDEALILEDRAGNLPIDYAVYGGNEDATKILMLTTPRKYFNIARALNLFRHALEYNHVNLASVLSKCITKNHIHKLLFTDQKPFIDSLENQRSLLQSIEHNYDMPAIIIKQFIDINNEDGISEILNKCIQMMCPKIAAGLLEGFQENNEVGRHETIDTMLQIALQLQIFKTTGKAPSLLDHDLLDMTLKLCKADLERHPEWLATIMAMPVRSGFAYLVDTLLRRMSIEAKQKILMYQLPAGVDEGLSLLHLASVYNNNEVLMTLLTHGGSLLTKDKNGMSVKVKLSLDKKIDMLINIASGDLTDLFQRQCLYHRYMMKILDEKKINPLLIQAIKKVIDGMDAIIAAHKASRDQAFLLGLWRIVLMLIHHSDENPNILDFYAILKRELNRIETISGRLKNSLLALRATFVMGQYQETLSYLNTVTICKNLDKNAIGFNCGNVSQLLMARMSLTIFDTIRFSIPQHVKKLIQQSIVSSSFNILMGVFCLDYIEADQLTASNMLQIYKKLDTLRLQVKSRENMDLDHIILHKKKNKSYIATDNFKKMIQESETDAHIFYHFLIKMEKQLWGVDDLSRLSSLIKDCGEEEKLSRLLEFYRMKKVILDLLQTAVKSLKIAVSLRNDHGEDWWNRYTSFDSALNITKIERRIKSIQMKDVPDISPRLLLPTTRHVSNKEIMHEEVYLDFKKESISSDSESDVETDLPTYYANTEEDEGLWFYEGKSDETTQKVGLKAPGIKKNIPITFPSVILDFMRSFGSDGCALVGGAVRDLMMAIQPKDWDFVVNETLEELIARFPQAKVNGVGNKKTLSIMHEGYEIELTPCPNKEKKFYLNFLNEVLSKRDFTPNAMAINYFWNKYEQRENWQFIDPYNGRRALLDEKRLTIVPTTPPYVEFLKDPVRLLRALRLCERLKLINIEEIFNIYKENNINPNDALFNINPVKFFKEHEKLQMQFKQYLTNVLTKREILNVFMVRLANNYRPGFFENPKVSTADGQCIKANI